MYLDSNKNTTKYYSTTGWLVPKKKKIQELSVAATVGYSNRWLQEMSTTVTDNYRKSPPRKEVPEAAPAE